MSVPNEKGLHLVSTRHFNNLTPAEAERLANVIECLAEVSGTAAIILHHGWEWALDTRDFMQKHMGKALAAMTILCEAGDVSKEAIMEKKRDYLATINKIMHHQPKDFL